MKRAAEKEPDVPRKKTKKDSDGGPHEQVEVEAPFGTVKVDKGMVDTLKMIWAEGYHTYLSCQNNLGRVWVSFDNFDFMKLVKHAYSTHEKDWATAEALGEEPESLHSFLESMCERDFSWQDNGHADENDYWIPGKEVFFDVNLRFDVKLHDTFKKLFKRSHTKK